VSRGAWDRLLDASVVLSFGRAGFERHARQFDPADLQTSLEGKTAWITGANSGIGYVAARALGGLGARVILLCRDAGRGAAALARIRQEVPRGAFELEQLDVSSLSDVRAVVERRPGPVHLLVHNAGVLPLQRSTTAEGHELTFATNVLGPFALTSLLRQRLQEARARVLTVTSGGMYPVKLSLAALQGHVKRFDGVAAYAQTKRAEVILNALWAARAPGITFQAMHPGWADTPGVQHSLPRFHVITRGLLRSPEQGADTLVWLAAAELPGRTTGQLWFDREPAPVHAFPWTRESEADRAALWDLCQGLTQTARAGPPA
jgi:dehydrogenase/reductase SDR family protein 12